MALLKNEIEQRRKFAESMNSILQEFSGEHVELLFRAVVFYMYSEASPSELTFVNVIKLLCADSMSNYLCNNCCDSPNCKSPFGIILEDLEKVNPEHVAVKYYSQYQEALQKYQEEALQKE